MEMTRARKFKKIIAKLVRHSASAGPKCFQRSLSNAQTVRRDVFKSDKSPDVDTASQLKQKSRSARGNTRRPSERKIIKLLFSTTPKKPSAKLNVCDPHPPRNKQSIKD